MTRLLLILLLSSGCASSTTTRQVHRLMKSTTGRGLYPQTAGGTTFVIPGGSDGGSATGEEYRHTLPLRYPPGIVTTNYYWFVEVSTNLVNWTNYVRVLSSNDVIVPMKPNQNEFFRMRGEP